METILEIQGSSTQSLFEVGEDGIRFGAGDILSADDMNSIIGRLQRLEEDYIKPGLVKCEHCSQWAAMYTECHKCGAPVGGNNPDTQIKGRTSQTVDVVNGVPIRDTEDSFYRIWM